MNKIWLSFVTLFFVTLLFSQTKITGVVKSSIDNKTLYDATVRVLETGESVQTDRIGYFQLLKVPKGSYTLEISKEGYDTQEKNIEVNKEKALELGEIILIYNPQTAELGVITLTDDELSSDESGSQSGVGLLQSSKDVFAQAAAYELGAYWFRTRGYDNKYSDVLFNGVRMNKIDNDRVDFGNWGGLNDITRHPSEVTYGIEPSDYVFGDAGGVTYIDTRPSTLRTGASLSYSLTNRSYRQRLMGTYNTGLSKNGWGLAVSGSHRWAEEGQVDGTFYDAWAYFLGLEKKFNEKHSLNLTVFGAPYRRSGNSPNTQEVFDLKGTGYNAYWGWQDGEKRSERVKKSHEPIFQLTHHWNLGKNTKLTTTAAYQFGKYSSSRLDWDNAQNPSPIYYRNTPNYWKYVALRDEGDDVIDAAEQAKIDDARDGWLNDPSYYQIDWGSLYTANYNQNKNGSRAAYYLVSDANEDHILTFNANLRSQLNDKITIRANASYQGVKSESYREINDMLGADYVLDQDDFKESDQSGDYNENTPNRRAYEGDKVQYNYNIYQDRYNAFFSAEYQLGFLTATLGLKGAYLEIYREGLFDHYAYDNSYGESEKYDFFDYGSKLELLFKLNGRNFIQMNGAYYTNAPTTNEIFPNGRDTNATIPGLESAKIASGDVSYILRGAKIKARATGFFTQIQDEVESSFGYIQTVSESGSTSGSVFTAEVLSGVEKQYMGAEVAIEAQLTTTLTASAVASIGDYTYTNNPDLYYFSDDYANQGGYDYIGNVDLEDYHLSGTAQKGFSLGLEYRDPHYWWVGVTGNYLMDNYVDIAPSSRTERFYTDPFGNRYPGATDENVSRLLKQEKFSDEFMLNANIGKTFRFGDYYMGVSLTINNVLDNKDYRTGGFEQIRLANYPQLSDENYRNVFGSRYWYNQGTNYFLNVFLRF